MVHEVPETIKSFYLSSDIVKICQHFAERSYLTNIDCYALRKQTSAEKIKQDIMLGKLAEWGVYFIYLARKRSSITPPDLQVYEASAKSFDADLKWGLFNLHIKSQTSESSDKFGDSWIFQSKDPLFEHSSCYDIMIGCRVSLDDYEEGGCNVEIRLEKRFVDLVVAAPKLSKFSDNKKAVYLKDNK
jgi:hypothetical protein